MYSGTSILRALQRYNAVKKISFLAFNTSGVMAEVSEAPPHVAFSDLPTRTDLSERLVN